MFLTQKRILSFLPLLALAISVVIGFTIYHTDAVGAKPLAQSTRTKPAIVLVHGAFC